MKVLVTGSQGYLGISLVNLLKEKGMEVIGFDKQSDEFEDLKYKGNIEPFFKKHQNIDTIIHLAALAGVEKDISEYNSYFENNVRGTFNLLEVMREYKVKNILFASSCSVYGNNQNSKEWDELKPCSFYGLSKVINEEMIQFYGRNHGINYNIFRIFNVIGRGGESDFNNKRLIPTLINNISTGQDINLFLQSNKKDTQVRDFVDLKFVCEVFSKFIDKPTNKIINIGSGKGVSGEEMANKMIKLLNKSPDDIKINKINKRKGDPDRSVSNNERLERAGFKYNKSIEDIAKE